VTHSIQHLTILYDEKMLLYVVLSRFTLTVKFRRVLTGNECDTWLLLEIRLMRTNFTDEDDIFVFEPYSVNFTPKFIGFLIWLDLKFA
jgi:hypothetical protein